MFAASPHAPAGRSVRAWQIVSAGVKALWSSTATRIGVCLDLQGLGATEAVQSSVEGTIYAMWRPETHRSGDDENTLPPLEEVLLISGATEVESDEAVRNGAIVGEAVNWSRWLANEPSNLMTPTHVAEAATELAAESGINVEVIEEDVALCTFVDPCKIDVGAIVRGGLDKLEQEG